MSGNRSPTSEYLTFETAEELALTRVPTVFPRSSVGEVRNKLSENTYDSLTHVAILEDTQLVGVLTIEKLFCAPEGSMARSYLINVPRAV